VYQPIVTRIGRLFYFAEKSFVGEEMKTCLLKIIGLCFVLIGLSSYVFAQEEFCNTKNTSFLVGEKLTYKVYYNMAMIWVPAAEAHFMVKTEKQNNKQLYHFIGDGNTLKAYEWFYKARDVYESYVDAETMLPQRFIRNVNEGGYKIHNDVTFNHYKHTATTIDTVIHIPDCVQDVLSAIFFARNIDFSKYVVGAKIPFKMFLDNQVYALYIRYLGKEKITTRYGTFNTIKFSPLLINGTIFAGGEKMTVWVSDDANHVPVRVDSPIIVGSVKVDLVGYENLRHPFSALISIR
jgi:hypothetical protein